MTLQKLANIAGVSVSTVSKAFSDSKEISDDTKKRIMELSKKYGCYEKYYKPRYNSRVIGVICPELLGVHYSQMVSYIEKAVSLHNDTLIASVSNFSPKRQSELIDYYINFVHVDGIIVIEPVKKIKIHTDVPIVQIGMNNESATVHCVDADIEPALDEAMDYIKKLGHKRIGYVGENYTHSEYSYVQKAVQRNNMILREQDVVINTDRFCDCGYYGVETMLESGDVPRIIFAAYSHIAVGIMKRLQEEKIRIPEDVSIICMDDINVLPYNTEKISCIKMHIDVLCSEATELLYRSFDNHFDKTKQVIKVTRRFDKGETIGKLSDKKRF